MTLLRAGSRDPTAGAAGKPGAGWLPVLVSGSLLLPSPWLALGLAGTLVLLGVRWRSAGFPIPTTPANLPLAALLGMAAVGEVISPAPPLGLPVLGQALAGALLLLTILDPNRSPLADPVAAAGLVASGLLAALALPFLVDLGLDKLFSASSLLNRAAGLSRNPNVVAGALAPVVPIALACLAGGPRSGRVLGAIALGPLLLSLALLQSRGALFALGAGLAAWGVLYRRWLLPLVPVVLLGLVGLSNTYGGPPAAELFYGKVGTATGGTLAERQEAWALAVVLVRQSPLVGIGLGAFPLYARFPPPGASIEPPLVLNHAHDLFLQVAVEMGGVGLGAFVSLMVLAAGGAWRAYRAGRERHLAIGVLAALTVVVAHGLGDAVLWGTRASLVLWVLLALGFWLGRERTAVEA